MKKLQKTLLFICLFSSNFGFSQPFFKAPPIGKAIKEITEWHRPDLKTKAAHATTSGYDKKGNLLFYYPVGASKDKWNSYSYDGRDRLLKKIEFHENIKHQTTFTYQPNLTVALYSFHDKTYRISEYFKKGKIVERKTFAKGGEIESKGYILLKRELYFYNKRDSLISEKTENYGITGRSKSKVVHAEKIKHHYDPQSNLRIHSEYFNHDNTIRKERYFTYQEDRKISKMIDYFPLHEIVQTTTYLYKKNKLWQKVTEREDQKDILVFVGGRPLRLRSYVSDKINNVVDYGYVYY